MALITCVLAFQEAERIWTSDDLTTLQAKQRMFDVANALVNEREAVEPGPQLSVLDGGRVPQDGGIEFGGP